MKKTKPLIITVFFAATLCAQASQAADYTNSIGMDFVEIKAGCFMMGSNTDLEDKNWIYDIPRHKVCITKPFYLGKTEVTQSQWNAVIGSNPSMFKGPDNPVDSVSWYDAQKFISRLNQKEGGNRYRLPTEAEWEYAARAGSSSAYHFGDDPSVLSNYAWFGRKNGSRTHPVAQKLPNQWGLYDMYGNVSEWVQDWYDENYYRNSPMNDPKGPESSEYGRRVDRGNSWDQYSVKNLRSAFRNSSSPDYDGNGSLGFRVVRTVNSKNKNGRSFESKKDSSRDSASELIVDGKVVVFEPRHVKGKDVAVFQMDSKGYQNTYLLDCAEQRFLWVKNVELRTGQETGNNEGAEWRDMNQRSSIANAVHQAACSK